MFTLHSAAVAAPHCSRSSTALHVIRQAFALMKTAFDKLREHRLRVLAERQFARLDERTLRDIGASAYAFDSFWYEATGRLAPTRRALASTKADAAAR